MADHWYVDLLTGVEWHQVGWWMNHVQPATGEGSDAACARALITWLDHRGLPDGAYRLRRHDATSPTIEGDYTRTRPAPKIQQLARDRSPYRCPHCDTVATVDERPADVIHQWCSACGLFADGCSRGVDPDWELGDHVPPEDAD